MTMSQRIATDVPDAVSKKVSKKKTSYDKNM